MKTKTKEVLTKYKINLTDSQVDKLIKFIESMKEYNSHTNITSITDNYDIIYKHILDCLLPINFFKDNSQVLDIGCGAGFPSIPLAIANPKLSITAIDSVSKKTNFVNSVKDSLQLENVNVHHTRIEDFLNNPHYREQFDIVVSRAVAPLNIILEYSAPALKNGGYIVAYKGSNYKEEIEVAKNALKMLDCSFKEVLSFRINEINAERNIIIIRKNSKIPNKYPRTQNKPRTQPL